MTSVSRLRTGILSVAALAFAAASIQFVVGVNGAWDEAARDLEARGYAEDSREFPLLPLASHTGFSQRVSSVELSFRLEVDGEWVPARMLLERPASGQWRVLKSEIRRGAWRPLEAAR